MSGDFEGIPKEVRDALSREPSSLNLYGTPPSAVSAIDEIREAAIQLEAARLNMQAAVDRAREQGVTWADIGAALGITKQTAWEKFGRGEA